MIIESEIRQKLDAIAENSLSVFAFGDWLDSHSWNMHADSAPEAVALASEALRLFAEYDLGLNEQELREHLIDLRGNVVIRVHILIDTDRVSRFVMPVLVPDSTSREWQYPEIWVPALS